MQLKKAYVLLVDDEPALQDIMGEWLRRICGQIFCAGDGAQALAILAAHKIDVMITDVRMPVMDGITLLKRMKESGAHTPGVIFITGFADISAREAYHLGAEALLEKPIEHDDLIKAAEKCLLDSNERWRKPSEPADFPVLRRSFANLRDAMKENLIAFGHGGFCIDAGAGQFAAEEPVNIELNFEADRYVLSGQGVVRWLANQENQAGIELTHVADASRGRVIELTANAVSFIPRSTGRIHQVLAR